MLYANCNNKVQLLMQLVCSCAFRIFYFSHKLKPVFRLNWWVAMRANAECHINLQTGYLAISLFPNQPTL